MGQHTYEMNDVRAYKMIRMLTASPAEEWNEWLDYGTRITMQMNDTYAALPPR